MGNVTNLCNDDTRTKCKKEVRPTNRNIEDEPQRAKAGVNEYSTVDSSSNENKNDREDRNKILIKSNEVINQITDKNNEGIEDFKLFNQNIETKEHMNQSKIFFKL